MFVYLLAFLLQRTFNIFRAKANQPCRARVLWYTRKRSRRLVELQLIAEEEEEAVAKKLTTKVVNRNNKNNNKKRSSSTKKDKLKMCEEEETKKLAKRLSSMSSHCSSISYVLSKASVLQLLPLLVSVDIFFSQGVVFVRFNPYKNKTEKMVSFVSFCFQF